ncbi:MAG: hypothetical protein EP319_04915 [Deltaproteobacteria bacterium]|nr:MAG: hypothetical protein EP319_04915 [Deltaproteobacteria bacterium]
MDVKLISLLILSLSLNAHALDNFEVQKTLDLIKSDFKSFYSSNPNLDSNVRMRFSPDENYVEQKNLWKRKLLFSGVLKAGMEENEQVEDFILSGDIVKNIVVMDNLQLREGKVKERPWSDDYWPIYRGILGSRYADHMFAYKDDWQEARNYVVDLSAKNIFESGDDDRIDELSPSEKYDLLFGKDSFSLSEANWAEGKYYYDRNGEVETWMGICHGWAPASYMVKRAQKKIQIPAYDGKLLNFYPADIKALSSLLWAKARFPVKFLGGRCNSKEPNLDDEGIRVIDQECFDVNPAAWHMSMVNQVGRNQRSFVFDATYDYQVWNQPVISYKIRYFNPNDMKAKDSLEEAMIKKEEFEKDNFAKYRSSEARQYVGIFMNVEYGVEVDPRQREEDSERFDRSHDADYIYDLELDEEGNIIGGEWYNLYHPDFIWDPADGARAVSSGDRYLGQSNWSGKDPVPAAWSKIYDYAGKRGEPLAKIVEKLIELSRQGE